MKILISGGGEGGEESGRYLEAAETPGIKKSPFVKKIATIFLIFVSYMEKKNFSNTRNYSEQSSL